MTQSSHLNRTLSRRELLRFGSITAGGLTLPELLSANETARTKRLAPRCDSIIIIHLNGGPSHLDMWDMKPEAPAETRGEFQSISSSLPGISVCEHLPRLSKHMHQATLVRSMNHSVNNAHAAAVYVSLTGHDRGEIGGGARPTDRPHPGAVCSLLRPSPPGVVPHAVLPYMTKEGAKGPPQPGFFAGIMGRGYDPLWILKDPNSLDFSVPEFSLQQDVSAERLSARGELLTGLNARLVNREGFDAMNRFQGQAAQILTSSATQNAFRIEQEPDAIRDNYGRNIYGQSVLLARRLIEAGTRIATVSWAPDANATWDTHSSNFNKLKGSLLPQFDLACSGLIEDLDQRGMLDRTMIAVLGDFGRTPKINNNDAGRDHWNFCYTLMMIGGGFRQGFVYGASDKIGAFPADLPMTPGDLIATVYHLLGIDHRRELYDRLGRPQQIITSGTIKHELLS